MHIIISFLKSVQVKRIVLATMVLAFLFSTIRLITDPSLRTGPFGIGLPAPMKQYNGINFRFSIVYPKSWIVSEKPQGNPGDQDIKIFINIPGRSWPNTVIEKKHFSDGDLLDVANYGENKINQLPGFSIFSLNQINLSGLPGLTRDYSWKSSSVIFGETILRCRDYYTLEHDLGYILTFCADEDQWPKVEDVFNQMIKSFSLEV